MLPDSIVVVLSQARLIEVNDRQLGAAVLLGLLAGHLGRAVAQEGADRSVVATDLAQDKNGRQHWVYPVLRARLFLPDFFFAAFVLRERTSRDCREQ